MPNISVIKRDILLNKIYIIEKITFLKLKNSFKLT